MIAARLGQDGQDDGKDRTLAKAGLLGKKGVFYLILASLFVSIMIVVFIAYKQYSYTDRQKVVETRITTVNDFIKSIDSDSKRVIYIAGFRSLIAIEDYMAKSGSYLNNTEALFRVAFFNGTINGSEVEVLENSTYSDYLDKLRTIADDTGIDIDINVTGITLYHDSPWSVNVIVSTEMNVSDRKGLARWEFSKDYSTSVSIINIRDPVYSVATFGRVPNAIRITNTTDYVQGANISNLEIFINHSYYDANMLAPSFLMRLSGNLSASPYGIESMVYIPELTTQGVAYSDHKSVIDYVLFNNATNFTTTVCNVQGLPSWFKLDINHTEKYEVDSLNYTLC